MKKIITFSVKGGDLPSDFGVNMTAEIDFTGVSSDRLIDVCCGGQSTRVKLQGQLRALGAKKLLALSVDTYKIHFDQIYTGSAVTTASSLATLLSLPKDEYMVQVAEHFGDILEPAEAEVIYDRKHKE